MTSFPTTSIAIAHEMEGRLRLRCPLLRHGVLDPDYLEAGLESIDGVLSVRVNTRAASVVVVHDGRNATRNRILASLVEPPLFVFNGSPRVKHLQSMLSLIGRAGAALAVLVLPRMLAAPLAAPLAWLLAAPVLSAGVVTLWNRGVKVAVLDAAAVLFCLGRGDFFTAASIVFLLSVAEYIEDLSENSSTGLLKSLLKPQVEKVWVEVDGQEMEIALDGARIGDRLICGPGEMVGLDGRVVSGEALVNCGSISGESLPMHVHAGEEVLSGSVVEEGRIVLVVTRVGGDTAMARISAFLENSLRYRSDSQKKSNELADRLVPVTFGLGLGLLALTRDAAKAAAVLTVDYSCVIKLTNPVTVRVAMYTAARQGVLLKGSHALEGLARIDTLVFDKTGTLTRGKLLVTDMHALPPYDDLTLLALAAGAEEHYAHPVAEAVVGAARRLGVALPPVSQVDFIVAHGVSAYVDGINIRVGSRHFIEEDEGVDCSALHERVEELEKQGKSLLYVAADEQPAGIIALRDELRPGVADLLKRLKESGVKRIVILTGDSELTARAIAARLPAVDEVHWELKPEGKARLVTGFQEGGAVVGFVGDGVNDAPALVTADVGICLPGGADLAKESAQVILLRDDLDPLLIGRRIALRGFETIQQGFAAAVGLNSAFLLLATFGMLQPLTSALLHNLSTVGILGYAVLRSRSSANGHRDPNPRRYRFAPMAKKSSRDHDPDISGSLEALPLKRQVKSAEYLVTGCARPDSRETG